MCEIARKRNRADEREKERTEEGGRERECRLEIGVIYQLFAFCMFFEHAAGMRESAREKEKGRERDGKMTRKGRELFRCVDAILFHGLLLPWCA